MGGAKKEKEDGDKTKKSPPKKSCDLLYMLMGSKERDKPCGEPMKADNRARKAGKPKARCSNGNARISPTLSYLPSATRIVCDSYWH